MVYFPKILLKWKMGYGFRKTHHLTDLGIHLGVPHLFSYHNSDGFRATRLISQLRHSHRPGSTVPACPGDAGHARRGRQAGHRAQGHGLHDLGSVISWDPVVMSWLING